MASTDSASPSHDRGVYVLGNDHVAGFLEPLFQSIRQNSPAIPVRLIPYNDQLEKTRALCQRYNVQIHSDSTFPELEKLGLHLWNSSPYSNHQKLFRRLSIFWGPFKNFLYLDADICVLAPLEPLFDAYERSGAQFACFDVDHERVYLAGPVRDRMIQQHGSLGFNSGHFFSSNSVFTLGEFWTAANEARPVAEQFQDRGDQGFLNFAVDVLGKKQIRMTSVLPDLADKQWCEQKMVRRGGEWHLARPSPQAPTPGTRLALIHWSGYHSPGWRLPNRHIYYHYRRAAAPGLQTWLLPVKDFTREKSAPIKAWLQRLRIAAGRVRRSLLP